MKKYLVLFSGLMVLLLGGCVKQEKACTPRSTASEEAQMTAYAVANGITATKHNSGLQYEIINPGTGATPTVNSQVFVTYTGKLLNGTVFDQSADPSRSNWKLGGLIEGWRIGIPLIKKGGRIKLIVPSSLAYGCNDVNGLPGNSVLFFDISLVDVQ
ncbi:hypothetical protein EXU57_00065 [Segetibacter sp. 3557_3]|uniref:FKBP-type peptidyl-prolyl cis-trans isomerase n=1 Tax=Segetibacter sp. 3557_3 TaxID=2547429 RepID=UPI0010588E44|nr:FKBP-type peptidyl-prolyl cis-trans isomerase [Segetibacter sp. 3557_3]TDH28515.1 hypothetical protein EXU57_00065 [Segetibacter sp. 3557_3]